MREHHVLRVVFGVALGLFTAASVVYVYLYSLLIYDPGGLRPGLFGWLSVANAIRGIASVAALAPLLGGLYRILVRPRPAVGSRPIRGLLLSVVGIVVALPLAFVGVAGPGGAEVFVWILVAAAVGQILFLSGLAMMVLWDPVVAWEPVMFPPPIEGPQIVK